MLTSADHPLFFACVEPPAGGTIGMTICPGKQAWGVDGRHERDLETDLDAVREWGAAALVTLMEGDELARLAAPPDVWRESVARRGVEWHHLPIVDGDVPQEDFEDRWIYSGVRLRRLLRAGARVAVHCRGGLGRTGTIAARLLIELGESPAAAVRRVRAARTGAIENAAQEACVAACRPCGDDGTLDRQVASIAGGAVGDGFGYAVEFDRLPAIRARFGAHGITRPVFQQGKLVVSDDTQMTLFTLDGLVEGNLRTAYLDWLATQQGTVGRSALAHDPAMRHRRAPGNTCLSALQSGGRGTVERPVNDSKGCGGVMRVAPVGLFPQRWDARGAFRAGAEAAAITHGHPSGYLSAGALAALVRLLVGGAGLEESARETLGILREWRGHEETARLFEQAMGPVGAAAELGEGWVGEEALALGLWAARTGGSFAETLALASNHDGDSDSTASIAGQIRGAWKGLDGMPHEWIAALDVFDAMARVMRRAFGAGGRERT